MENYKILDKCHEWKSEVPKGTTKIQLSSEVVGVSNWTANCLDFVYDGNRWNYGSLARFLTPGVQL